jgi:hypothetical protein
MEPQASAPISKKRMALAFLVAAVSDAGSIPAEAIPPLEWGIDIVTAVLLLLILGFHWQFVPALIVEAIPGLAVFPSWMAAVLAIVAASRMK